MSKAASLGGLVFPAVKISIALVLVTLGLLISAQLLKFVPQEVDYKLDARKKVSESLAIQISLLSPDKNLDDLKKLAVALSNRNTDILSTGIRLANGKLIYTAGSHQQWWGGYASEKSTPTNVVVPIYQGDDIWGHVEVKFSPLTDDSLSEFTTQPFFKLAVFILLSGFVVFFVFMLRIMRKLDPSAVVPERVNAAFDTLAEGVIILDEKENVVLINKALAQKLQVEPLALAGKKASDMAWVHLGDQPHKHQFPWLDTLESGKSCMGFQIGLPGADNKQLKFAINCSPIRGEGTTVQGVLVTLDDITQLEERNTELRSLVDNLKESQVQIRKKNKELNFLATRDSLTGCLNRRAFNDRYGKMYHYAAKHREQLFCIMVDIDHFKAVNDNFGHSLGDDVIKLLANIMLGLAGEEDIVGRYGGEEFCMILPGKEPDRGVNIAEKIRLSIKENSTRQFKGGPRVTVSAGVACITDNPSDYSELNRWADEALYVAKESGRNRVVRWIPELASTKQAIDSEVVESYKAENKNSSGEINALSERIEELEDLATNFCFELEYSKLYDALTGLPNQLFFIDRVKQVIDRGSRHGMLAVILVVDVGIVDSPHTVLNRKSTEQLLKSVSERISKMFRKYDSTTHLTLSRFSVSEFAILLNDITDLEAVTWIVRRVLDSFDKPVELDQSSVYLNCHIGIGVYSAESADDKTGVDDLINAALIAKQNCKKNGSGERYLFYDPIMQEESNRILQLDSELRSAIKEQQWQLLYQPKVDLESEQIIGVEALIRWNHPQRGLLSAYEFISFAESRGFIIEIGNWVIEEACRQLAAWRQAGITNYPIAVNLSPLQVQQSDFVRNLLNTLQKYKIQPKNLAMEVTENILMQDMEGATSSLAKLKLLGIDIAVDDFGTGYSSFNYLKNLPISALKIDRTFIIDLCKDKKDRNIVKSIIEMAHSMNLLVVAEGVEDQEQLDMLRTLACDQIQGYLISKPVSSLVITELLAEEPCQQSSALPAQVR